jgi:hypothetical protein
MALCFYPLREPEFNRLLPARIFVLAVIGLVFATLHFSNKLIFNKDGNYYERYHATGAYEKYREYQGVLWEIFEERVLIPQRDDRTNKDNTRTKK